MLYIEGGRPEEIRLNAEPKQVAPFWIKYCHGLTTLDSGWSDKSNVNQGPGKLDRYNHKTYSQRMVSRE